MPARKRFNAFEDFPSDSTQGQKSEFIAPPLPGKLSGEIAPVERIERLKPSQMLPDRFQPRRLLPPSIRQAFFHGQIDCYEAARGWLELSRNDDGIHAELERLLAMGSSFEAHGQIKPITGSWIPTPDGRYIYQIETGERRFWAACLQTVSSGAKEEPLLRVEVVANPTRQRQVLENRHAETPSAVEQGCEVASLILAELGILPDPDQADEYEYFRQARAQRMPTGLWDKLMPVMQLTRPRMVQLLNILQLPSQLLDLADRYRLPERVLREVLSASSNQWERMLRAAVQNQLTSDEVAEMASVTPLTPARSSEPSSASSAAPDPVRQATRSLRRFAILMGELDEFSRAQALDEMADTLVANRQADGVLYLMEELSRLISARLKRR